MEPLVRHIGWGFPRIPGTLPFQAREFLSTGDFRPSPDNVHKRWTFYLILDWAPMKPTQILSPLLALTCRGWWEASRDQPTPTPHFPKRDMSSNFTGGGLNCLQTMEKMTKEAPESPQWRVFLSSASLTQFPRVCVNFQSQEMFY